MSNETDVPIHFIGPNNAAETFCGGSYFLLSHEKLTLQEYLVTCPLCLVGMYAEA